MPFGAAWHHDRVVEKPVEKCVERLVEKIVVKTVEVPVEDRASLQPNLCDCGRQGSRSPPRCCPVPHDLRTLDVNRTIDLQIVQLSFSCSSWPSSNEILRNTRGSGTGLFPHPKRKCSSSFHVG